MSEVIRPESGNHELLDERGLLKAQCRMSDVRQLFTGIRVEDGRCMLLTIHLERLAASAQTLDFRFDREDLERALIEVAQKESGNPPSQMSVTISRDGLWKIKAPQRLLSDAPRLHAMLWPDPVDSRDPLLRHKLTPRPVYDYALCQARSSGFIDALFHNKEGFVTEGADHSIFVRHGNVWRAPTLNAGISPGAYRSYVMEKFPDIREEDFTIAQLMSAEEVWLTNAIRGVRSVTIVSTTEGNQGSGEVSLV